MVDSVYSNKPIVTITGITGFCGSEICFAFLKDGGFNVRGTVRDKNSKEKVYPIAEAFGE